MKCNAMVQENNDMLKNLRRDWYVCMCRTSHVKKVACTGSGSAPKAAMNALGNAIHYSRSHQLCFAAGTATTALVPLKPTRAHFAIQEGNGLRALGTDRAFAQFGEHRQGTGILSGVCGALDILWLLLRHIG